MRIAIHVDCPPWNLTGIGRYMMELSRSLAEGQEQIEAWSRAGWYTKSRSAFTGMGIPVLPILSWKKYEDTVLPGIYAAMRKPSLVHNPNGSMLPIKASIPQTVMVHDLGVFLYKNIKPAPEVEFWQNRIQKCVESAAAIMVNSETTANDLEEVFPGSRGKTFLTLLGVDHLKYRNCNTSGGSNHILAVGTIEPRKNYEGLLNGYKILSSKRKDLPPLVIAGGFGYRSDEIRKRVTDLGLEDKVRLEGYVTEERLHQLYINACCLAHTAIYEGFGFTVPEALGFGLPVVCSSSGALGELFRKASYMVNPVDPESIADGMLKALDNGQSAEQKVEVKLLFENLTWANCAEQTRNAFNSLFL